MLNVVIFFWIRRITIHLFIKKTIKFKPFGEIGNVSLTKKSEIKKMWKINYRFQ
jgi:hypothetical protein